MKLLVFNGSPRGKNSNTSALLVHFLNGFTEKPDNIYEIIYLNRVKKQDEFVKLFQENDHLLLAFPLYTDAMPAVVKTFIESLQPITPCDNNKSIGFIVQSGFGEAIHSRYVEKYLQKLSTRLGCKYTGTVIRGGVEGIREMPAQMTKRLFKSFHELGRIYGENEVFDTVIMHRLAKRDRYSLPGRLLIGALGMTGFMDTGWNIQLKRNGAFEKRHDKPYFSE